MAGGGGGYFGGTPADSVMAFALGEKVLAPSTVSKVEGPPVVKGPSVLPEGPGKALVMGSCGGSCHTIETVTGVRRNRVAWQAMVESMIAPGAAIPDKNRKAIVVYLVT